MTLSFATVTSRLHGLLKGSFRGIEVLKRGVSPRIISAYILGSRGRTLVSGPELAARLELISTWEYFSVSRGTTVKREPDVSGSAAAPTPPTAPKGNAACDEPTGRSGGACTRGDDGIGGRDGRGYRGIAGRTSA